MFTFWSESTEDYIQVAYELNDSGEALFLMHDNLMDLEEELMEALDNYLATEDENPSFTDYELI